MTPIGEASPLGVQSVHRLTVSSTMDVEKKMKKIICTSLLCIATENATTVGSAVVDYSGQAGEGNYWANINDNSFSERHDILGIIFDNGASNISF